MTLKYVKKIKCAADNGPKNGTCKRIINFDLFLMVAISKQLLQLNVSYDNKSSLCQNPEVECYKMVDIETHLKIDREGLVSMGLLLGCDFCPKGVPGVGKEMALKLAEALKGENILER